MSRVPRCVYCDRELVAVENPSRQCSEPKSRICHRDHSLGDTPRAAHLPDGTVVAGPDQAWMKDPDDGWFSTHSFGGMSSDRDIDDALAAGARVLRYGYQGSE